jgi:hypothetical protein
MRQQKNNKQLEINLKISLGVNFLYFTYKNKVRSMLKKNSTCRALRPETIATSIQRNKIKDT